MSINGGKCSRCEQCEHLEENNRCTRFHKCIYFKSWFSKAWKEIQTAARIVRENEQKRLEEMNQNEDLRKVNNKFGSSGK